MRGAVAVRGFWRVALLAVLALGAAGWAPPGPAREAGIPAAAAAAVAGPAVLPAQAAADGGADGTVVAYTVAVVVLGTGGVGLVLALRRRPDRD